MEAHNALRNMLTPSSGDLGPVKSAVPLNELHFLQLGQVLDNIAFELLARYFVMRFHDVNKATKVDSRLTRFDRVPYPCGNGIEAVAEPLSNIEKHSAIFGICGTDVWRNQPRSIWIRFHAFPPAEVSGFEANGLGAG